MKIKNVLISTASFVMILGANRSQAVAINLFDFAYKVDGVSSSVPGSLPGVDDTGFDFVTGLGTITYFFDTPGNHFAGFFVDHEIDQVLNTFFNEYGLAIGIPEAGQSWEIDEPGFLFGDVYTNFAGSDASGSLLDNTNGVPSGAPDDVSMALGRNFSLLPSQTALISFSVSKTAPSSGFYLQQTDPESAASIYFSSQGSITPPESVPDVLNTGLALGCVSLLGFFLRRPAA